MAHHTNHKQTRYYAQWMDILAKAHQELRRFSSNASSFHSHKPEQAKWIMTFMSRLDRQTESDQWRDRCEMRSCLECMEHFEGWKKREMDPQVREMTSLGSFLWHIQLWRIYFKIWLDVWKRSAYPMNHNVLFYVGRNFWVIQTTPCADNNGVREEQRRYCQDIWIAPRV